MCCFYFLRGEWWSPCSVFVNTDNAFFNIFYDILYFKQFNASTQTHFTKSTKIRFKFYVCTMHTSIRFLCVFPVTNFFIRLLFDMSNMYCTQ